jgi:adenylyl-sulfate kinase
MLIHLQEPISREERIRTMKQKPFLVWLTGLSGSGKSTLASALEKQLFEKGFKTYLLDGDLIRAGLNKDLGFSKEDRRENIRRIGEVCKLMTDAGLIVITAFISPFRADRDLVRTMFQASDFAEIFVKASLEVCETRDVKGLYNKARKGLIPEFTGISSPYEEPLNPELTLNTDKESEEASLSILTEYILKRISIAV